MSGTKSLQKELTVAKMASLVVTWTPPHGLSPELWEQFLNWGRYTIRATQIPFDSPNAWLLHSPNEVWFSLMSLCRCASKEKDLYGLMFALGSVSYRSDFDIQMVHVLWTLATSSTSDPLHQAASSLLDDQVFDLSPENTFDLSLGHTVDLAEIQSIAKRHCIRFQKSPQFRLPRFRISSGAIDWRLSTYNSECETQCRSLAQAIFQQWPRSLVEMPSDFATTYPLICQPPFKEEITRLWSTKFLNLCLFQHTKNLQSTLDTLDRFPVLERSMRMMPPETRARSKTPNYTQLILLDLVQSNDRLASTCLCPMTTVASINESSSVLRQGSTTSSTRELLQRLTDQTPSGLLTRYVGDLQQCVDALETRSKPPTEQIRNALRPRTVAEKALPFHAGLWPSRGPQSLLSLLSLPLRPKLDVDWLKAIFGYAEALAATQRDRRKASLKHLGLDAEGSSETANRGGEGWEAVTYPDWLLIQLDADLLIRPVQASIAQEMMHPSSEQNITMQLDMGEGKSSVSAIYALFTCLDHCVDRSSGHCSHHFCSVG